MNDKPKQLCRPEGAMEVIKQIVEENKPADGAAFSFEKDVLIVEIVRAEGKLFLRRTTYTCAAENNGRSVYSLVEDYYDLTQEESDLLSVQNHGVVLNKEPAHHYMECDYGAKY